MMARFGYVVKLVRDRVHQRIGGNRDILYERVGSRQDHVRLLRAKLVEEVGEYLIDPSRGELADIFEAVRSLAVVDQRTSMLEIEEIADAKVIERGGFLEGMVMVATDDGAVGEKRPEWTER
jgi:predicted house-cleaning noncanonical NTP pyrophosphatase (MazG superfamily)